MKPLFLIQATDLDASEILIVIITSLIWVMFTFHVFSYLEFDTEIRYPAIVW